MSAFRSDPDHCGLLEDTGWVTLPDGSEISQFPVYDTGAGLFARLGHGPATEFCTARGCELPSVEDYRELHKLSHFIKPYTLPTPAMLMANVRSPWQDKDGRDTPHMAAYRARNMMTREWCAMHDMEVFVRIAKSDWSLGDPVSNAGKHWASPAGTIFGWWLSNGTLIQNPSQFHASDPTYCDYATTFHIKRPADVKSEPTTTDLVPWLDPSMTPGQRQLAWSLAQLGHSEDPPNSNTSPLIRKWASRCSRDGVPLGSLW